jgi:hypothetical protein
VCASYFSASARRSSVVTRVPSAMMNAISLLVVMKRAPLGKPCAIGDIDGFVDLCPQS